MPVVHRVAVLAAIVAAVLLTPVPRVAASEHCVSTTWGKVLAPKPQSMVHVESVDTDAGSIMAFRFGPIAGEFGKVFVFLLDDGQCFSKAVIAGSYEATNKVSRELGDIGPEERLYHIDLYEGARHQTLGFSKTVPEYDEVRAKALELMQ